MSKRQHGFKQGRSCLLNLINSSEQWTQALDKKIVDVIYFGLRNAFNSGPNLRMFQKLNELGINGKFHNRIESFIT